MLHLENMTAKKLAIDIKNPMIVLNVLYARKEKNISCLRFKT